MQSYGTTVCVCVCVCVCACVRVTKALQPGVWQEWGTKQTTQDKAQTNQPTWHPYDRVPGQAQVSQLKSFVQYRKIKTGPYKPMTHHVTLQKTAVLRSSIKCHSNFSSPPVIATKFLSISFIPKFPYSHVCINWPVHTSNLTDMTAATSMTYPFITITDFQKLLHLQTNYLCIRPSVIKAVHKQIDGCSYSSLQHFNDSFVCVCVCVGGGTDLFPNVSHSQLNTAATIATLSIHFHYTTLHYDACILLSCTS